MPVLRKQGHGVANHLVVAYDMSDPGRARRVRAELMTRHHAKQLSVFELCLSQRSQRSLLRQLAALCAGGDCLAAWRPCPAIRWENRGHRLAAVDLDGGGTGWAPTDARGNFMVCYDVSDPGRLRRLARLVAAEGAMVQRSVYWLRLSWARLQTLLEACLPCLDGGDRLWVYPLVAAGSLWRYQAGGTALMPVSGFHWSQAEEEVYG